MNDPFGSMNGFINQFRSFMQNPAQFFIQRQIPQGALDNPQATVQQLLNSGQMSQAQLNKLQQIAGQIQRNPLFGQIFK